MEYLVTITKGTTGDEPDVAVTRFKSNAQQNAFEQRFKDFL